MVRSCRFSIPFACRKLGAVHVSLTDAIHLTCPTELAGLEDLFLIDFYISEILYSYKGCLPKFLAGPPVTCKIRLRKPPLDILSALNTIIAKLLNVLSSCLEYRCSYIDVSINRRLMIWGHLALTGRDHYQTKNGIAQKNFWKFLTSFLTKEHMLHWKSIHFGKVNLVASIFALKC